MTVMEKRLEFHEELCSLLGTRHVYFQPPETVKIIYPAIVYSLNNVDNRSADNITYKQERAYRLTVIDRDPDSSISVAVSKIPRCRFERSYTADNLNHFVYILYI